MVNNSLHVFLPQYLVLIISTAHFSSRSVRGQIVGFVFEGSEAERKRAGELPG